MKRPKQHIIESISQKAFLDLIPDEWVSRKLDQDYGLDYLVELFDNEKSTGKMFFVQLKGTSSSKFGDQLKINLSIDSLNYYRSIALPILFLVYSIKENNFRGLWINEYLKARPIKKRQKSLVISLNELNIISKEYIEELKSKYDISLKDRISIITNVKDDIEVQFDRSLVKWINYYYPDYFAFDNRYYPAQLILSYDYNKENEMLSVNINYSLAGDFCIKDITLDSSSEMLSYTLPCENRIPKEISEILFIFSLLFGREHTHTTLKIWKLLFCEYGEKYAARENIAAISVNIIEQKLLSEFQEVIEQTITQEKYSIFQILNFMLFFYMAKHSGIAIRLYQENLEKVIDKTNDRYLKGTFCYNYANSLINAKRPIAALRYYLLARIYEPDYLRRPYWWKEIGSIFYNAHHYKCAEYCYKKVIEIFPKSDRIMFAYIGDSLFYQMKFAQAKRWYNKSVIKEEGILNKYVIKSHICEFLIFNNYESKLKNARLSNNLVSEYLENQDDENILDQAISANPLNSSAWFQLGLLYVIRKLYNQAMISFLTCSAISDTSREAWFNAFLMSIKIKNYDIAGHIFGALINDYKKNLVSVIHEHFKVQPLIDNQSLSEFLQSLEKIIEDYLKSQK